jgi:hypothetical protein
LRPGPSYRDEIIGLVLRASCRFLARSAKPPELDYAWSLFADMDFGRGFDSRRLHQLVCNERFTQMPVHLRPNICSSSLNTTSESHIGGLTDEPLFAQFIERQLSEKPVCGQVDWI